MKCHPRHKSRRLIRNMWAIMTCQVSIAVNRAPQPADGARRPPSRNDLGTRLGLNLIVISYSKTGNFSKIRLFSMSVVGPAFCLYSALMLERKPYTLSINPKRSSKRLAKSCSITRSKTSSRSSTAEFRT